VRRMHGLYADYIWQSYGWRQLGRAQLHYTRSSDADAFATGAGVYPEVLRDSRVLWLLPGQGACSLWFIACAGPTALLLSAVTGYRGGPR
jgi:hypothetical protein